MAFELLRNDPRTQNAAYAGEAVAPAQLGPADLTAHTAPAPAAPAAPGCPPRRPNW